MKFKEPIIFTEGFNREELHQWMEKKVSAANQLRELQLTKAELELSLLRIKNQIEEAAAQSQIHIMREVIPVRELGRDGELAGKPTSCNEEGEFKDLPQSIKVLTRLLSHVCVRNTDINVTSDEAINMCRDIETAIIALYLGENQAHPCA